MVIPFFWGSVAYNFTALENFVVKITQSKLVGYPIPELFGINKDNELDAKVLYLERILSVLLFLYGAFFVVVSFIPNGQKRWKLLSLSIAIPLFVALFYFWIKFNHDDHIIGTSEKEELLQFTLLTLITAVLCTGYGLKKPRIVKKKSNPSLKASNKFISKELQIDGLKPPTKFTNDENKDGDDSIEQANETKPVEQIGNGKDDQVSSNTSPEELPIPGVDKPDASPSPSPGNEAISSLSKIDSDNSLPKPAPIQLGEEYGVSKKKELLLPPVENPQHGEAQNSDSLKIESEDGLQEVATTQGTTEKHDNQ